MPTRKLLAAGLFNLFHGREYLVVAYRQRPKTDAIENYAACATGFFLEAVALPWLCLRLKGGCVRTAFTLTSVRGGKFSVTGQLEMDT